MTIGVRDAKNSPARMDVIERSSLFDGGMRRKLSKLGAFSTQPPPDGHSIKIESISLIKRSLLS